MDPGGPVIPHVIPIVLPPCLALAEMRHASGKDLLAAVALAAEVGGRVGGSVMGEHIPSEEPPYYKQSPRYGFSTGVFGGVAGASKLLQMDGDEVANALGIGGASAPVAGLTKWQYIAGPQRMVKYNVWVGWIAQLSTVAALMASQGFTGDPAILDGEFGFWQMYGSPFFREEVILNDLGKVWRVLETRLVKPYPNCGRNHTANAGIIKLVKENAINPEDITQIKVMGNARLLSPCRAQEVISNTIDAQFSVKYAFAMAALDGSNPGIHWEMLDVYTSPRVFEMMKRVKIGVHPRYDEFARENLGEALPHFPAIVEIEARGKKYSVEVGGRVGEGVSEVSGGVSDDDVERRFTQNVTLSPLPSWQAKQIVELVHNLESVEDVDKLGAAMRGG